MTVFDRHRYAAMETSFANGGQLSASNAEVWNSTARSSRASSGCSSGRAAAHEPARAQLAQVLAGWRSSWRRSRTTESNTIDTVKLAIAARELLLKHAKTYDFDFNRENRGILHFYSDPKEFAHAEKVNELYKEGGLDRDMVTPEDIGKIEPALAGGDYLGGYFTPSDFTGDIHRYTVGLAEGIEKEGVSSSMASPSTRWSTHGKR